MPYHLKVGSIIVYGPYNEGSLLRHLFIRIEGISETILAFDNKKIFLEKDIDGYGYECIVKQNDKIELLNHIKSKVISEVTVFDSFKRNPVNNATDFSNILCTLDPEIHTNDIDTDTDDFREWLKYINEERENFVKLVESAIETNSPILCSF